SRSQLRYVRKAPQKLPVIFHDGGHAGLLEHNLRKPYAIRLTITPPGQVPTITPVPLQKPISKAASSVSFPKKHTVWFHAMAALHCTVGQPLPPMAQYPSNLYFSHLDINMVILA